MKQIIITMMTVIYSMSLFAQSPGDLDNSFNANDKGFYNLWGANNTVYASAVLPDGKYLIAGAFKSWNGTSRNGIARINVDGTLDATFNPGTAFGNIGAVYAMVAQADGKILLGGTFSEYNGTSGINNIVRLNADGTVDNTFTTGTGFDNAVWALKLQPDGKILAGGNFTNYNGTAATRMARLNADGTRDATFSVGTGANQIIYALGLQSDGKIIIGGNFTAFNGTTPNRLVRVDNTGAVDATFNVGAGANTIVDNIAVQPDGKILVVGNFTQYNGETVNRIVRLNTDGTRDASFNVGGTGAGSRVRTVQVLADNKILIGGAFTGYNGITGIGCIALLTAAGELDATIASKISGNVYTLVVQPDNKIVAGGEFYQYEFSSGTISPRFARLNANGTKDNTFNEGTGFSETVRLTAVQPDGKILVAGVFAEYFGQEARGIVRLNADGSRDNTFSASVSNSNLLASYPVDMTLQPDGKILLSGTFTVVNGDTVNGIVRLNADGSRDLTFNAGTGATDVNGINGGLHVGHYMQPDGKILLGGAFVKFNGTVVNQIVRLNADGSRDLSFNAGGSGFTNTYPGGFATDADGMIYFTVPNNVTYNGTSLVQRRVARLFPDGKLDMSFWIGNVSGSGGGGLGPVVPLSDGSILVGTSFLATIQQSLQTTYTVRGPLRFFHDGTLDTSFTGGVNKPGINTLRGVYTIKKQTDGRILIGGSFTTYQNETVNHLARLMPDGSIDPTFSSGVGISGEGFFTTGATSLTTMALYPGNKLIIGGVFTSYNTTGRNFIARIELGPSCSGDTAVDVQKVCGSSFTWIDGKIYTSDNNTAIHTIIGGNSNGCDSTVRLNLTFLQPSSGTDVQTICGQPYYVWIDGVVYIADNNTATYTIAGGAANGCDSIVQLDLRMYPLFTTPSITADGGVLNTGSYADYQWYYNSNPISGETDAAYTPALDGNYHVVVTDANGCEGTSAVYTYSNSVTGISNKEMFSTLNIYPNPMSNMVSIVFPQAGTYRLSDMMGNEVKNAPLETSGNTTLDVSDLSSGVYCITITTPGGQTAIQKLVKR